MKQNDTLPKLSVYYLVCDASLPPGTAANLCTALEAAPSNNKLFDGAAVRPTFHQRMTRAQLEYRLERYLLPNRLLIVVSPSELESIERYRVFDDNSAYCYIQWFDVDGMFESLVNICEMYLE